MIGTDGSPLLWAAPWLMVSVVCSLSGTLGYSLAGAGTVVGGKFVINALEQQCYLGSMPRDGIIGTRKHIFLIRELCLSLKDSGPFFLIILLFLSWDATLCTSGTLWSSCSPVILVARWGTLAGATFSLEVLGAAR